MRKIIMMSVLFLLFITGIMIYLGNEGYCYKTGKFFDEIPAQERIDKVIRNRILPNIGPKMVGRLYQGNQITIFDPKIRYNDIEEFKKINPDCCMFYKYGVDITFLPELITGEIYGVIDTNYLIFRYYPGFTPNHGLEFPPVERGESVYFISRCGEVKSFFDYL